MNSRIQKLRKSFKKQKIEGLLVSNPVNIRYLTGFFGLSPDEREAFVLATKLKLYLLTDSRYRRISPKAPEIETLEIKFKSRVERLVAKLAVELKIQRLGFEANNLTFAEYKKFKRSLRDKFSDDRQKICPILTPTKDLVESLRMVKEAGEIEKIKKAAELTDNCLKEIKKIIKPGLAEKEIAFKIERFIREKGAELAFPPIVAADQNSSLPHYSPDNRKQITKNAILLLDFGAKVDGYCADMTRILFLGRPTTLQQKVYQTVKTAQEKALSFLKSHYDAAPDHSKVFLRGKKIDALVRKLIKNAGWPDFPHGLGHGVGLSEHEKPRLSPKSKDILSPGMVFTIEPGIYLPQKFGIRIEDLVLLKREGIEILTKAPKEIIAL